MAKINKEPASPIIDHNYQYLGLTKREHFAGLALQGLLASGDRAIEDRIDTVKTALDYADLLLEELD